MTLRQIAEKYGPRIKAFLGQVAAAIRSHKVEVDDPAEMFEPEETWQWGIIVYPWAKHSAQQLPDEALDIWLKLVSYKDEDRLMVDIVCDLITVGGGGVEEFDTGQGLMPADDRMFLEETVRYFEQPATIRKIVKSALKYITEARKNPPSGPHEWSPRWHRRPSMGAPAKPKSGPFKINLVELPEWKKHWEPGNAYFSQASDLAYEYVKDMTTKQFGDVVVDLTKGIYDRHAQSGPQEWSPRPVLGPEDLDLITDKLHNDPTGLELTYSTITDAATWMYETALGPDDGDVQAALETAREKFAYEKRYDMDWDLWEPLLKNGVKAEHILLEMLESGAKYVRNQGEYDRYLDFNWNRTYAPAQLMVSLPTKEHPAVLKTVFSEWKAMAESFAPYFIRELAKQMKDLDVSNRINWKAAWAMALAGMDKETIHKEMIKFVRDHHKAAPK